MLGNLQEGIYYAAKSQIGNSFCILSLAARETSKIRDIGIAIGRIWSTLTNLKNGIISDLNIDKKHRKGGNLTTLVAYGSKLFDITGSEKSRPLSFGNVWNFNAPYPGGGGPIFDGSTLTYSTKVFHNHLLRDHIIFQFIADNEFYTNRAVVEVWRELHRLEKNLGLSPLRITGLYTGFQRADHRNWLGFHDGVSNLKRSERLNVIPIGSGLLNSQDKWTQHGTYIAFIRIAIDLERWIETSIEKQEIIIGRDKLTGCPLIRVDRSGKPVKDSRCPIRGTSEVIDPGNEYFRDHPIYGSTIENKILQYSHIGNTNPSNRVPVWDKKSLRTFRQGFEFLVPSNDYPGFIAGLNFVSFQNSPERLFRALTYRPQMPDKSLKPETFVTLNQYMSVQAAGIFFVPPVMKYEPFPGAKIFFDNANLKSII
jgi:Dyp-type peroxidase family